MVTDQQTRVIDPEFAFYGPMGFDVGMLIANFWMAISRQSGHETGGRPRRHARTICSRSIVDIWTIFRGEFSISGAPSAPASSTSGACSRIRATRWPPSRRSTCVLHAIWTDMLGFAGVEMHRRILGLAHNADFETIEDTDMRAACEARALKLRPPARRQPRASIHGIDEVNALAERHREGHRPMNVGDRHYRTIWLDRRWPLRRHHRPALAAARLRAS